MTPQELIKEEIVSKVNHSAIGLQTGHIEDKPGESGKSFENNSDQKSAEEDLFHSAENSLVIMEKKGHACDDCGQVFDTVHDVQRHVKSGWCPENRDQKRRKHEEISDSE